MSINLKKYKLLYRIFLWSIGVIISLLLIVAGLVYIFKDKIIGSSISEINKYLNAKVDINPKIELSLFEKFPQVALGFKEVKIFESIPQSTKLLGKAEIVYLTFDIWNIIDGNYVINKLYVENGTFNLFVDKNGVNNYSILKKDSTQKNTGSGGLDLTNIYIKNVLVNYSNEENEQYYQVLSHELKASFNLQNENYLIKLIGPQLIKTIRIHDSEYFKEKEIFISSDLEFNNKEKRFTILPTTVKVEKSEFKLEGSYLFKNENIVDIKLDNERGDAQTLLSLIPKKYYQTFSAYKSEGEIYFHATIKGIIAENENALINIMFGCKNASFFHPDLKKKITKANLTGSFTNGKERNAQSSELKFENINFSFDDKLVKGNFFYKNFKDPFVAFDASGMLNVNSIIDFYKIPGLNSASGSIDFNIDFKGLLNDFKTKEGHNKIEAGGEITFHDLTCVPTKTNYTIEKTNGTLIFNKNDISINDFTTKVGKSDFMFNGILKNLFGSLLLENGRMLIDMSVQSNYVDFEELLSFKSSEHSNDSTSDIPSNDKFPFLQKYAMKIDLDLKSIGYKKVHMNKFKGALSFDQPYLRADNINFLMAGGSLKLNSFTNFDSEQKIETTISSELKALNIDSLLFMFDNFGQDFITYKNLKGEFSGTVETALNWKSNGEIDQQSIVANIDGQVLKGELNEFEPMQNLARFIDAEELAHIKFSEIKNKVFIENRKISFPEMQILSNVSDISISGTHTFDNEMDYKLKIPLKNLRKHKVDKDASFGAIEEDLRNGSTLFLTIKGKSDSYKIGYDTKRTKGKIQENLQKEKREFKELFKKKEEDIKPTVKPNQEEFFDW